MVLPFVRHMSVTRIFCPKCNPSCDPNRYGVFSGHGDNLAPGRTPEKALRISYTNALGSLNFHLFSEHNIREGTPDYERIMSNLVVEQE